jgi:hypothetical protein
LLKEKKDVIKCLCEEEQIAMTKQSQIPKPNVIVFFPHAHTGLDKRKDAPLTQPFGLGFLLLGFQPFSQYHEKGKAEKE